MKNKTIKTYKFSELSEDVQRRLAEEEAQSNWEWTTFGDITEYIDDSILSFRKEGALFKDLDYSEYTIFNEYGTSHVYLEGYISNENLEKYIKLLENEGEEKALTTSYNEICEILEKLENYISIDKEGLLHEIKVDASSRIEKTKICIMDDWNCESEILNYFYEDVEEEHYELVDRFGELIEIIENELVRIVSDLCEDAESLGNTYCEFIFDIDSIIEEKMYNDDEDYTEDGYVI